MTLLPNIESASGLSAPDRDVMERLVRVFDRVAARNTMLSKYYECEQPTPSVGIDNIPETVDVPTRCDWASKAVTSVSERVRMDGFSFPGDYADESLAAVERASGLSSAFNRHVASELVHGCMFATVQRTAAGAAVRTHTAETAAAIWDEAAGRIGAGFVIADSRVTGWSPYEPVPVQVNLHLPGRVVVIGRTGPSQWSARSLATPIERPMMEPLCFRPTGMKPFGQTRITPTVRYLVDEVQRTLRYMAVSAALYATPKDVLIGLTDKQFDAMEGSKFAHMVDAMMLMTRDRDGSVPQYTRLQSASPQPFIDSIATYAKLFSGATGVPLNSLGIVQDNPSSAEAIAAQREDVCVAAEDLIESNRAGMREVALMAMAVAGNKPLDALTDEQRAVIPNFRNPMRPSLAATADAYVKIAGVLEGFSQTREFLRGVNFTEAEAESIRSQLKAAESSRALMAIMGGAQRHAAEREAPAPDDAPDMGTEDTEA